ncbi:MAG: hypothetical protein KKD27_03945 [Gammaproteobacteria bacterium]|jgi:hypothetical protein|uniref:hypothetical protein n=1 Tax=Stutzerimonas xanthomarina TaxID=271420 RepID=UPI00190D8039|nr:hypothetical protein [Stutzerimonas xanthomarina]MBU0852857.1 hypothetical protein [Gammaproteobacteria bacterium]MBK3848299.1 hypothetical protein [Stutzerimonas xanthomarina]MBU1458213.1 hypothetical protein [Gammaproteobacteria bacterium]MBU2281724.1 hypothetical protein [Gammaproteobacteria bacterium]MBU2374167.1 hypothetical protein [Gammaproteobacteria bacterium]|tara:strand:+ start:2620 stop:3231 length:612 start_codon:yes stop_codon:yes gene_type:complete
MNTIELERLLDERRLTVFDLIQLCEDANEKLVWHPLGFVSGTFIRHEISKARLHIWPTDNKKQIGGLEVHDHTFDFTSWVIQGTIESQTFTPENNGELSVAYCTTYTGSESVLTKTSKRISITHQVPLILRAGDKYFFEAGRLHRSRVLGKNPAVTVLITAEGKTESPLVLGPEAGQIEYRYQRSALSKLEQTLLIERLRESS